MQLTVVVENQTSSQQLLAEWGYSAWLQTDEAVVLLDTGGIQHTLQHNLAVLGLNAKRITDLVLSHGHFDHTSGVMDVLRLSPAARVWAPLRFRKPSAIPVGCARTICSSETSTAKSFPTRLTTTSPYWCRRTKAPRFCWAAHTPDFPTFSATRAVRSASIALTR